MSKDELKNVEADIANDATSVVWQKCFKEEICIKIPFDGKKCVSASGCVRILLERGVYFIEIQLFGTRKKFELLNQCITGFTAGVASLKVCISKLKIENGKLKGVRIDVRLCIEALGLEKCWNVIGTDINFYYLSDFSVADNTSFEFTISSEVISAAKAAGLDIAYVEQSDSVDISTEDLRSQIGLLLHEGDYPWWR